MQKKKKRLIKKKYIPSRFKLMVEPSSHTISHTNPFYRSNYYYHDHQTKQVNWLQGLKKDSAVNPFKRFGPDRLGLKKTKKKKNLSWIEAKKRYPKLSPFGDADKDGVINIFDCKPFDKKRQDTKVGDAMKMKKPSKKAMQALALQEKLKKITEDTKKTDLEKASEKRKRTEKDLKKAMEDSMAADIGARRAEAQSIIKNLPAEELIRSGNKVKLKSGEVVDINKINTPEARREMRLTKLNVLRKQKEQERATELEKEKLVRAEFKAGTYGRPVQIVANAIEPSKDLAKGLGKAATKRYSAEAQATSKQIKGATLGIIGALTETGGMFEDTPNELIGVGRRGGLARVRQRLKQTRGKVGRPVGSIDPRYAPYGGVEGYRRYKQQQRQIEIQRAIQQQARSQQQIPIQNIQQQVPAMTTPTSMQMQQQPEEIFTDAQAISTFSGPMSTGYITPELISSQPMQPQPMQQGPKDAYAQTVPATSLAKGNPFNTKARYRPNFSFNPLKYISKNLMTGSSRLLEATRPASASPLTKQTVIPATTISTRMTTSNSQMVRPTRIVQQEQRPTPDFTFQNSGESGMLA